MDILNQPVIHDLGVMIRKPRGIQITRGDISAMQRCDPSRRYRACPIFKEHSAVQERERLDDLYSRARAIAQSVNAPLNGAWESVRE